MSAINLESVQAGHVVASLPQPEPLRRVDNMGQRFYYTFNGDVRIFPSVTSILRATMPKPEHLVKWYADLGYENAMKVLRQKASYGTLFHILCGKLLIKGTFDLNTVAEEIAAYRAEVGIDFPTDYWEYELKRDLLSFAQFCAEKEVKVEAVEVPLLSDNLGYAGTIDLVCELTFNRKRVRAIIDLKSGRNGFMEEYELQLEAYRQLWNNCYPEYPATMIFNFSPKDWRKEPTYELKNQTESTNLYKWPLLLAVYQQGDNKPKPFTMVEGTLILGRETGGLYSIVEIEDHLKRIHSIDEAERVKEAANVDSY